MNEKQVGSELGPSPRGMGKDGNSERSEGGEKCYWNKMTWNSEDRKWEFFIPKLFIQFY